MFEKSATSTPAFPSLDDLDLDTGDLSLEQREVWLSTLQMLLLLLRVANLSANTDAAAVLLSVGDSCRNIVTSMQAPVELNDPKYLCTAITHVSLVYQKRLGVLKHT